MFGLNSALVSNYGLGKEIWKTKEEMLSRANGNANAKMCGHVPGLDCPPLLNSVREKQMTSSWNVTDCRVV